MAAERPASLAGELPDFERRLQRVQLPACAGCGSLQVRVRVRTEDTLYLGCDQCQHVWRIPKPPGSP